MGSLSNGWKIAKMCFGIAWKDKEMMLYPLLSAILSIVSAVALLGFSSYYVPGGLFANEVHLVLMLFVIYFTTIFFSTFFNVAIVHSARMRLEGGDPTFRDGIHRSAGMVGTIVKWSLLAAFVGILIRMLRSRRGLSSLAGVFAELTWGVATFFIIPVLAYENLGPWAALQRSATLLKEYFDRDRFFASLVSGVSLSAAFLLLYMGAVMLGVLLFILFFLLGFDAALLMALGVFVITIIVIHNLGVVVTGVWVTTMYIYLSTNKLPDAVDRGLIENIASTTTPKPSRLRS